MDFLSKGALDKLLKQGHTLEEICENIVKKLDENFKTIKIFTERKSSYFKSLKETSQLEVIIANVYDDNIKLINLLHEINHTLAKDHPSNF